VWAKTGTRLRFRRGFRNDRVDESGLVQERGVGGSTADGDEVDLVYTPKINEWRGNASVELTLKDLRPSTAGQ
jgi:hypothetical protein